MSTGHSLTDGQRQLGSVLLSLPTHPQGEGRSDYLIQLVRRLAASEETLRALAEELAAQIRCDGRHAQPDYQELQRMAAAAARVQRDLVELYRRRK
jgi:hypothetical protein